MDSNLGPVHTTVIDGSLVTFQRHLCGVDAGSLHTYMGDFGSFQELTDYVRGVNAAPRDALTPVVGRPEVRSGGHAV